MLNESDQALILIRNLPADARQFVLLHAQDDELTALSVEKTRNKWSAELT